MATRPRLLLLDEVNAGLNAAEIDRGLLLIERIASDGITIMLIEHLMKVGAGGVFADPGAASWGADRGWVAAGGDR